MKEYRKIARTKFLYEIAKDGTIRNIKSKKIMKPNTLLQNGYPRINLTTRFGSRELQKQTTFLIHRLVMETWQPREDMQALEVHHKDGNPLNYNYNNLEWLTAKEHTQTKNLFRQIDCVLTTPDGTVKQFKSIVEAAETIVPRGTPGHHGCRCKLAKRGYYKGYTLKCLTTILERSTLDIDTQAEIAPLKYGNKHIKVKI